MAIEFTCSGCSNTLRVPDEHAGKHARCPQCSTVNTIPNESPGGQQPDVDLFGALPSQQTPTPATPVASSNPYAEPQQGYQQPGYGAAQQHNQYAPNYHQQSYGAPHRGGLILALGIVSFFCNFMLIPGILAWTMGRSDLKEMKAGRMDRSGEGITMAGMVIGIITTAMFVLLILFYVVIIIIGIGAGVAGGM